MEKYEKIFFEEIVKDASVGDINCGFLVPICFGTRELVNGEYVDLGIPKDFGNMIIPTLLIKDRDKVVESIYEYVNLAKEFYKDEIILDYVDNKEKYIIASLLSNTLTSDFNDIDLLFKRHSNFISDNTMLDFLEVTNLGYCDILKSNVVVKLNKQSIVQETPYALDIWLEDDDEEILYKFPSVRFGIDVDKAYIYAVQRSENDIVNKKIERILRKVGEGFDEKNSDKDPVENPENLYSINPWSLVALSIAIPLIKNNSNVKEFVAPYFLVNRWNAPEVSYNIMKEKYPDNYKALQKKEEQILKQDIIQRNITDKFIRNFRRLEHHFSNFNIVSYQLENDSCLHLQIDNEYNCNNTLLSEVSNLSNSYNNKNKTK